MTKQYLTVVFEYDNGAKYPSVLTGAFAAGGQFEDVTITAVSLEDEISRVEELEDELVALSGLNSELAYDAYADNAFEKFNHKLAQLIMAALNVLNKKVDQTAIIYAVKNIEDIYAEYSLHKLSEQDPSVLVRINAIESCINEVTAPRYLKGCQRKVIALEEYFNENPSKDVVLQGLRNIIKYDRWYLEIVTSSLFPIAGIGDVPETVDVAKFGRGEPSSKKPDVIGIQLHFSCERLEALRERIDSNRHRYKQAKINSLEIEVAELEFMLSSAATDIFLKNCPDVFFDMGISVVSKEALPYRDDKYHSYSNPRYCTNEQNYEVIDQLKKSTCPELEALLEWMIKHEEDGWIIVGVFDLEVAGLPITGEALCLSFSEYIFARQKNDPTFIPRDEGNAAFQGDKLETDNPYEPSSIEFDAWQEGYQCSQWQAVHTTRLKEASC